jgi:hypothetical protein
MILTHSSWACWVGSTVTAPLANASLMIWAMWLPCWSNIAVVFADTPAWVKPVKNWLGKPVAHHAMKRPVAVGPVLLERQAIAARDRVYAESAFHLGRDLAGSVKQLVLG